MYTDITPTPFAVIWADAVFQGFEFAHRNTMDIVEWSTNYPLIPMVIRLYT